MKLGKKGTPWKNGTGATLRSRQLRDAAPWIVVAPHFMHNLTVWGRDTRLDRIVAIKVLKGSHSERFQREARAIAALNHPRICTLYDIGPDYRVMEYIEGKPLRGPLPLEEALRYAIQIGKGRCGPGTRTAGQRRPEGYGRYKAVAISSSPLQGGAGHARGSEQNLQQTGECGDLEPP